MTNTNDVVYDNDYAPCVDYGIDYDYGYYGDEPHPCLEGWEE